MATLPPALPCRLAGRIAQPRAMGRRVPGDALDILFPGRFNFLAMKESNLMRLIMLAVGKLRNVRLFRNNVAEAWQGGPSQTGEDGRGRFIKIYNYRPIHAGLCNGSSDLIGWTEVTITEDMVGQKIAVFTALEVKQSIKSVVSKDQLNFLTVIKNAGGIAGLARDEDEATRLLRSKG